jgi:Mrp family chromosome partitioning ATPase
MERLEAALAKAREQRRALLPEGAEPVRAVPGSAAPTGPDWLALPETVIPHDRALRNRITALIGGKDAVPYDMLRSRTIRTMKDKSWTRLAVTSPDAGCGKTTVALNLALSLSRQKDLRVMLIDLDLRRPSLGKVIGHAAKTSVWEVLEKKIALTDHATRIGENLIVATNATPCRHPAELLQAQLTAELLDQIEAEWKPDVMIFDMSPMLASDDNVGFLGNVDCALLVAAAESTRMTNIDLCEKELAQLTNVLGIVLNKCRYADDSVGYSYGSY